MVRQNLRSGIGPLSGFQNWVRPIPFLQLISITMILFSNLSLKSMMGSIRECSSGAIVLRIIRTAEYMDTSLKLIHPPGPGQEEYMMRHGVVGFTPYMPIRKQKLP